MSQPIRILALGTLFALGAWHLSSPSCLGQVWARGISPQRAPNLIGELPHQPNRPSEPIPRLPRDNILPHRIETAPIPKSDFFFQENLRAPRIEVPWIDREAMVKQQILPKRMERTITGFRHLGREPTPVRPSFGSTIFLPAMPLPRTPQPREDLTLGRMPKPGHRRTLGW